MNSSSEGRTSSTAYILDTARRNEFRGGTNKPTNDPKVTKQLPGTWLSGMNLSADVNVSKRWGGVVDNFTERALLTDFLRNSSVMYADQIFLWAESDFDEQ